MTERLWLIGTLTAALLQSGNKRASSDETLFASSDETLIDTAADLADAILRRVRPPLEPDAPPPPVKRFRDEA